MTLSTVSTSRSLCRLSFRMYQGASTIPRSTLFRNLCIMCLLIRMAVFILLVNQRGGIFARSYVKGVVMKCPEMICVVAENDVLESWKLVLKILPQNYQLCSVTCIFWLTKNSSIRIPWQYIVHNTTVWSITRQFSVYSKPSTGLCPVRNYHKPWWWLGISRNLSDFFCGDMYDRTVTEQIMFNSTTGANHLKKIVRLVKLPGHIPTHTKLTQPCALCVGYIYRTEIQLEF